MVDQNHAIFSDDVMTTRFAHLTRLLTLTVALFGTTVPALADLQVCNRTQGRVGVAIGFKDRDGWTTEGWWNIAKGGCETILRGPLVARFYYLYGIDYDQGGEWAGKAYMCTRDKEFTIRGIESCLTRGYDRTGFFEVDTGDQKSWIINFTDPAQPAPAAQAPTPNQPDVGRRSEPRQQRPPSVMPGAMPPGPPGTGFTVPR